MNPRQLFTDDDAVSPVIGVILMVAITVILAAVIATFVLGLGDQVSQNNPQASFSFSYDSSAASDPLTITHDGGKGIDPNNLYIRGSSVSDSWANLGGSTSGSSQIKAGNSVDVPASSSETVNVVWENPNGDNSATLGTWNGN